MRVVLDYLIGAAVAVPLTGTAVLYVVRGRYARLAAAWLRIDARDRDLDAYAADLAAYADDLAAELAAARADLAADRADLDRYAAEVGVWREQGFAAHRLAADYAADTAGILREIQWGRAAMLAASGPLDHATPIADQLAASLTPRAGLLVPAGYTEPDEDTPAADDAEDERGPWTTVPPAEPETGMTVAEIVAAMPAALGMTTPPDPAAEMAARADRFHQSTTAINELFADMIAAFEWHPTADTTSSPVDVEQDTAGLTALGLPDPAATRAAHLHNAVAPLLVPTSWLPLVGAR